jgi:hypothetical protein
MRSELSVKLDGENEVLVVAGERRDGDTLVWFTIGVGEGGVSAGVSVDDLRDAVEFVVGNSVSGRNRTQV